MKWKCLRGTFIASFLKSPFLCKINNKNNKISSLWQKAWPCLSPACHIHSFWWGSRGGTWWGRCCHHDTSSVGRSALPMKGCPARLHGAVPQCREPGIFEITKRRWNFYLQISKWASLCIFLWRCISSMKLIHAFLSSGSSRWLILREKHDCFSFHSVRAYHSLPLELWMYIFSYAKNLDGKIHWDTLKYAK